MKMLLPVPGNRQCGKQLLVGRGPQRLPQKTLKQTIENRELRISADNIRLQQNSGMMYIDEQSSSLIETSETRARTT